MSSSVRIAFIEQFYYPEGWGGAQLPRDITIGLAEAGYCVEVFCGSDQYAPVEGDAAIDPADFGVTIRRVPRLLAGDIHHRKLVRQIWFYIAAVPSILFRRRPALYVAQTNPPLMVVVLGAVSMLQHRPMIIIAQDIYPEITFAHGMFSAHSLLGGLLSSVFRWTYRRAQFVVSLGPTMTRRLLDKGVAETKICEISNWATGNTDLVRGAANRLRSAWNLEGKFVLVYSGNLGVAHEIQTLIRSVARALPRVPHLRLVFVGMGGRLEEARQLTKELNLEHSVSFEKFVSFELLPHSLGLADLAVVTLKPGFEGLVVPSKLLGHMARGVPTLYIGPDASDVALFIARSHGGVSVANGDVESVAESIVALAGDQDRLRRMGEAAASYYRQNLSQAIGMGRYLDLVRRVVG